MVQGLTGKLSARLLNSAKMSGRHSDGRGAFGLSVLVRVNSDGSISKTFQQRIKINGKWNTLTLGKYPVLSLQEARSESLENARAVFHGKAPTKPRGGGAPVVSGPTVTEVADQCADQNSDNWSDKYATNWIKSIQNHVLPKLGKMLVSEVSIGDIHGVLAPIWNTKRPTAEKVHQRISDVLNFAVSKGFRSSNPCGKALLAGLPRNGHKVTHHKAVPHTEVRDILAGFTASWINNENRPLLDAVTMLTLTATRSAEVLNSRWEEIEIDTETKLGTWVIPASRTKTKEEHRVPITPAIRRVLLRAWNHNKDNKLVGLIFPTKQGKALHQSMPNKLLRQHKVNGTVHGMRSVFVDWATENGVDIDVREASLGHAIQGVRGAYQRTKLLEQRREVLNDWNEYVMPLTKDAEELELAPPVEGIPDYLRFVA